MTKVTIDRELLERAARMELDTTTHSIRIQDELRAILDAPRQPEGEGLEVVASQFPEINFSNYGQDEVEALQAWGFTALDAMADAQRAIAELDRKVWEWSSAATAEAHRVDELKAERDTLRQQIDELREELDAAREILAQQGRRNTELRAERDTLRQQLAERDAELKKVKADRVSCWAEFKVVTRACLEAEKERNEAQDQRDKLAGLLRDARELIDHGDFREGWCMCGSGVEGHSLGDGHTPVDAGEYYAGQVRERIDAALVEVNK